MKFILVDKAEVRVAYPPRKNSETELQSLIKLLMGKLG